MSAGLLVLGLAMLMGAITDARAQAPPQATIDGNVYAVTYVEVMPTSRPNALAALRRYREATRQEDGNLRCEVVSRLGQPHQFAILEVWKDAKGLQAHGTSATATQLRDAIQAIRNAPLDLRVHIGVSVGSIPANPGAAAVWVVTHVDVIPPRKDDGLAAVRRLGDVSRAGAGNVRFEVVQQTNRPNHFTLIEIWQDATAVQTHSMAAATRQFHDTLAPMSGALYDERMFTAVD